eukprot:Protomagalhaensia_sp_Gyna_25__4772@NODE_477_length_3320_cov_65_669613_g369_i0_p1_GENE_NODE_477_length_3320_cov_65_669613_g369_i0NODE_477_length_3320_cov_65_669613_g369_i0_p1_ORF_typecomplete_len491_score76_49UDPGT/PF00201_18/2_7e28Glyco_tran_28_C/PF04101_16/5_3e03Glyco_tran_28_C/PF04101_16/0_04FF/PF01846_19/0_36FF/PF01846_19/5_4e03DUF5042/PF16445_5/1e03DUF5042/PF16445_5/0_33_NODE_477_length_3320_cov_65_669613_g369_i018023274
MHILAATSPGFGHLNPLLGFLDLCLDSGLLSATLVVPVSRGFIPFGSEASKPHSLHHPRLQIVQIELAAEEHEDDDDPYIRFKRPFLRRRELVDVLLAHVSCKQVKPTVCVYDMYATWLQLLANEAGFPAYVFHPSPAPFALFQIWGRELVATHALKKPFLKKKGSDENEFDEQLNKEERVTEEMATTMSEILQDSDKKSLDLPGYGSIDIEDLPWEFYLNEMLAEFTTGEMTSWKDARGLIVNDVEWWMPPECRAELAAHVRGMGPDWPGHWHTWFLGPCLQPCHQMAESAEEVALVGWMSQFPKNSVIYVAFGTLFSPSEQSLDQLRLAIGERPTLWVKGPKSIEAPNIKIVPWAPQRRILRLPTVGCFITHCGWNSVLECLTEGGAAMAMAPFTVDQRMDAHFLETRLRVGMRVCRDAAHYIPAASWKRAIDSILGNSAVLARLEQISGRLRQCRQQDRRDEFLSFIHDVESALQDQNPQHTPSHHQ